MCWSYADSDRFSRQRSGLLHRVLRERSTGLHERVRSFGRVDIAVRVDRDAFAGRPLIHAVLTLEGRDERGDPIFVDRPDAHDEEADMTLEWFPLADAAHEVLSGKVVNGIAVAGILAAHAVTTGFARPRPVDSPWQDKPTAFAARKAAQ